MKILAVDTTTKFLCIGIYDDGRRYEYGLCLGKKQSAELIPAVKDVCDALRWRMPDIDYFACGLGPGSFTGMRLGLSAMKGFAWALKKPLVGIPSLDTLAMNASLFSEPLIAAATDAKRGLIYCSLYQNREGRIKRLIPYMLTEARYFVRIINRKASNKNRVVLLGDAIELYKKEFSRQVKFANILDSDYYRLYGRHILTLALDEIKKKKITDAFRIRPIYLYPKECQIRPPVHKCSLPAGRQGVHRCIS